jgi:hypothetical protein
LILAADTKRMPLASKIVKITDSTELRPSWPDPRSQYAAGADVGGGKSEPEVSRGRDCRGRRSARRSTLVGVSISTIPLPSVADQPLLDIHASTIVERDS